MRSEVCRRRKPSAEPGRRSTRFMAVGKNLVAVGTGSPRTTSRCGKAVANRTREDPAKPTSWKSKGHPMDALFFVPCQVRSSALRESRSRTSGLLGNDEHDPVRSFRPVPPDRGGSFDHSHRKDLVATQRRFLTALVSHAVDNEEQRYLRRRGRQGGRNGRCQRLRSDRTICGARRRSGEKAESGEDANRDHLFFRASSTSSVGIHRASWVNPHNTGLKLNRCLVRASKRPLPRPGRTYRDPLAETPGSVRSQRSCRRP